MNAHKAPSLLTPGERMAKIGGILATGYRRLRLCREKGLDVSAESERTCASVNGTQSKKAKEVA